MNGMFLPLAARRRRSGGGAAPYEPITEGPFDATEWRDLPVGGTFVKIRSYFTDGSSRPNYGLQFFTPPGPLNENGEYGFEVLEDGVRIGGHAFRPEQLPGEGERWELVVNPNTSRLTITTNAGDQALFDVELPVFTGPNQAFPPGLPPVMDDEVRAIVEGVGFVYDPSDLTTLLDSAGGAVTGPGLVSRMIGKWGPGVYQLNAGAPFPSLTAEKDIATAAGNLLWGGSRFLGGDAYCVTVAMQVPTAGAVNLYRRETGSGNVTLDINLDSQGGLTFLVAGTAQQQATRASINAPSLVVPGRWFVATVVCNFAAGTVEAFVNGRSVGTATFTDAPGPAAAGNQNWVLFHSTDRTLLRRVVEYAGLPTAEERDIFERWVRQDAGLGVTLEDQVRDIIGTSVGFAFDPMDFATLLTTGSVPVTAHGQPVTRIGSKWGTAPVAFTGGGASSLAQPQGIDLAVLTSGNSTWNGDTAIRTFFRNREAIFICQAMQPAARPPARAHSIAASQVSGAMGRATLHTDFDLSVTFNYRRTDLGDGAGRVELPPDTLVPGQRNIISCEVDFVNGGARIWNNGALGQSNAAPAAGGNLEDTLGARVRYGSFTAGGVNEFWGGGLGRAVYLPFIPTAQQRAVIEAWVGEPVVVPMTTFPDPTLTERVQGILRQTKGFALDPQDLATVFQDEPATIPVTAAGQPVAAIRSKFGNTSYTYRNVDADGTTYAGDGAIAHDGVESGLFAPNDNFTNGNTGMTVVARTALAPSQQEGAPVFAWQAVGGGTRLAFEVGADLRPSFAFARPDANKLRLTGADPVVAGGPLTLSLRASYASTPARMEGFVNGALVAEDDLSGTPLTVDNVNSPFAGHGAFDAAGPRLSGYIGRAVFAHFVQTDKDMRALEAWVEEGPWPAVPPVNPPGGSLDQQVEAILAGTRGFVFDPQDLSTMWQDSAKTIPVTGVGQVVGAIASKWGTDPRSFLQPGTSSRPMLLNGGLLQYDGVDDHFAESPNDIFRNVPAMFVCMKANVADLVEAERTLFHISNSTSGGFRMTARVMASGAINFVSARSATNTSVRTPAGTIAPGTDYILSLLGDYATDGRSRAWVDGALITDIASLDTGSFTPDVDSLIGRIMRMNTATFPGAGKHGRMVFCPFSPTPEQLAVFEAWVAATPPPTPEEDLTALFATKRLGYVVDPRNTATILQAGSIPVTADGQSIIRASLDLVSGATGVAYTQATVASQPIWVDNSIDPDGVDDSLIFPTGGTSVQPDFENLAGFVASLLVTPGTNRLQVFWTAGFGGTNTNNRLTIQGLADGAVQFAVNDGVARRIFATPAGVLAPGTPVLLTLFVDFQTREAKGFVDGVERASFTLLNVTDLVNANANRARLFMSHGTGEYSDAKLHRAAFLHDRTDDAGRTIMENWVKEAP